MPMNELYDNFFLRKKLVRELEEIARKTSTSNKIQSLGYNGKIPKHEVHRMAEFEASFKSHPMIRNGYVTMRVVQHDNVNHIITTGSYESHKPHLGVEWQLEPKGIELLGILLESPLRGCIFDLEKMDFEVEHTIVMVREYLTRPEVQMNILAPLAESDDPRLAEIRAEIILDKMTRTKTERGYIRVEL